MMPLNDKEWGDCQIDSFATVNSGRDIYAQERIEGNTPYITSGTTNNGVGYFVDNDNNSKSKNAISVNRNGAVGEAFYHPYTALYGNDCRRVNLKKADDEATQLFVARCISNQKDAFSYSRKLGTGRLKKLHVMLPVTDKGDPDYAYMSEYVQEQKEAMLAKYREYAKERVAELGDYVDIPALEDKDWKEFRFDCLFDLLSVQQKLSGSDLDLNATTPVYTSQTTNNGISGFTHKDANFEARPNKEMLVFGDHTRAMNIAQYPFAVADNVKVLKPKDVSFYSLQFVATVWQKRIPDIGYARHWRKAKAVGLSLPINDKGEPDFEYMEQYSKNMMLKKYKQYLAFLENQEGDELSGKE